MKEIDSQNREIRRVREEQKRKDHIKETEVEKQEKDIAVLTESLNSSKTSAELYKNETQKQLEEKDNKILVVQKKLDDLEALTAKLNEMPKDTMSLEIESLLKKNAHLREQNEKFVKKSVNYQQGRCHRGTLTEPMFENIQEQVISSINNDDCSHAMDDLANELVLVKNELTILKAVLEEKDRELSKAKSISSLMFQHQNKFNSEVTDPELQKLTDNLKFQLYSKCIYNIYNNAVLNSRTLVLNKQCILIIVFCMK